MPPNDKSRADRLIALARDRFDVELRDIEVQVLVHSCRYEDPPDWTAPTQDKGDQSVEIDPTIGPHGRPLASWQGPELRPALLRWLLTDPDATALLEHRGLRVWNARISEVLDLRGCRIATRVEFRYCIFAEEINLISAEVLSLYFRETTLQKELEAARIRLHGPLFLDNVVAGGRLGFSSAIVDGEVYIGNTTLNETTEALFLKNAVVKDDIRLRPALTSCGEIGLMGVQVGGVLNLSGAKLSASAALNIDGAQVRGNVHLGGGLVSTGKVRMMGVQVGGLLDLSGAKLEASEAALNMDSAKIGGDVYLDDGFVAVGEVRMIGAEIGGALICGGATLSAAGDALSLDSVQVRGNIHLNKGFNSAGTIRLNGAVIDGQLICGGASLRAAGNALVLDGIQIRGSLFFDKGFNSAGTISLNSGEISGQLSFRGATLSAAGDALILDGARIRGHVFLDDGFNCTGTIQMLGAEIGGQLNCRGANLTAIGDALICGAVKIGGNVFLDDHFSCSGQISMHRARIGGNLLCESASILSFAGEYMELKGYLRWRQMENTKQTKLNLIGASLKGLYDDFVSWRDLRELNVNGLVMEDIHPLETNSLRTTGRIAWLNRQPENQLAEPQPWLHLSKHFEDRGHKRAAKRVILELRKHQSDANWKNRKLKWLGRRWDRAFAASKSSPFAFSTPSSS
jgi:hypothetical protein